MVIHIRYQIGFIVKSCIKLQQRSKQLWSVDGLKQITATIKTLEETKATLEDSLKRVMGDAETLITPSGTVLALWKNTKDTQRFNPKAFQAADPQEYAKYIETIPGGRRFTVK